MMMTFDYGRHLGHGQLDKMGVTLFGDGRLLAADYGTPAYGSAILPYYLGTASHNTVMVDGPQPGEDEAGGVAAVQRHAAPQVGGGAHGRGVPRGRVDAHGARSRATGRWWWTT